MSSAVTSANGSCQTSLEEVASSGTRPRSRACCSGSRTARPTAVHRRQPRPAGSTGAARPWPPVSTHLAGPAARQVHEQRVAPRGHVERDVERDPRFLVQHRLDPVLLALRQRDPVRPGRQVVAAGRVAVPVEGVETEGGGQPVDRDVHPLEAADEQLELVGLVGVVLEEVAADRHGRDRLQQLVASARRRRSARAGRRGPGHTPRRTRRARRADHGVTAAAAPAATDAQIA